MTSGDLPFELKIPSGWGEFFHQEEKEPYFSSLINEIEKRYGTEIVFPKKEQIFRCMELLRPEQVKVIILGQDPYHEEGQANGLAFSVSKGIALPRSLSNIYKELNLEYGYPIPKKNGCLEPWAEQGVLLLNTTLTVKEGEANSHSGIGWQTLTDHVISYLDRLNQPIVYILWGNFAYKKKELIHSDKASIIHTAHPSPLSASRGFFHSECFLRCNDYLEKKGLSRINWQITDD